jgi:hypothetical protein
MNYFKSVLIGLGTVLLGCVVAPIVGMIWYFWKASKAAPPAPGGSGERLTVSFSPLGLMNHAPFWWFIIALFSVGFFFSVYLQRR